MILKNKNIFLHAILLVVSWIWGSLAMAETLASPGATITLAQAEKKKKKASGPKERKRTLVGEKRFKYKKGDKTNLDFDAADISGERKTPMGSLVDSVQSDKDYDFVRLRLNWNPEMVQSASSLETGRSSK